MASFNVVTIIFLPFMFHSIFRLLRYYGHIDAHYRSSRTALYDRSLSMLNLALPLLDIFTVEPSSASSLVQIFTEVSLVKRMFYQLRAWVYYRLGNVVESEENAEVCLELLPSDALCSYVLSISKLVTGRFVDSVKAAAPVLSQWTEPEVFKSVEFIHLSYLKEWARYLHSHFTQPMVEFHWLTDLSSQFKQHWVQSVALESVPGYKEQPGISSELPNFVASPKRLKSILFDSTVFIEGHSARVGIYPVRSVNHSEECSGSWTLGLLHSGPCQSLRLKRLGQFLCQLDSTFYLFLPSAPVDSSPTVAPFNQRHRVSIALAALHSAESIRNYWCERRRVSFGTCWSYSPNQNDPQLSQRTTTYARNSKLDDWTSWSSPYCTRPTNPTASSNTHQHCRSPNSEGPDWLVHTSATARFLQLADPSGAPTFWHSDQETSTGGKEFSTDSGDSGDSSFTSGRTFFDDFLHQRPATGFSGECYDSSRFKSSTNGNSGHCENEWRTATVRDQRFFIQHSQVVPDTLPYVPAAFRILSSVFRIRALLNPDGTGILDDSLTDTDIFGDFPSHFPHYPRSHDDSDNRSTQANTLDMILSYLDHLWTEAGERDLFDHNHRVALNLFVPGRVDLARSGTSDLSSHRYLAGVLLFEKDINKNYMLSMLVLSNAQHRHELGAELDAAFEEFLVHGEKALASILAGSNSQTGTRRLTSPFEDHYLQDAVNSAFHWLYYWIILKPIESVYSFHVGFGLVLGMLRALGVEPKSSIPVAERSLELEALFVGSPESFASVCRSLLNLSWLSYSSLTLTWQVAPETLIQHPKMFTELLNLQAASECSLQ
ncbi:Tetratricopeptide repeat protein 13 [Fasciola hepatica]|uniref:Tetratricopeptide repeat protein 13 n=1 Tax=Fasciola hepatica TaxID=6192 RepID=A0A4E0RD97_FASHE|nr:Tetratricopeptide repeat protein 13 [Fasciola hepatica]